MDDLYSDDGILQYPTTPEQEAEFKEIMGRYAARWGGTLVDRDAPTPEDPPCDHKDIGPWVEMFISDWGSGKMECVDCGAVWTEKEYKALDPKAFALSAKKMRRLGAHHAATGEPNLTRSHFHLTGLYSAYRKGYGKGFVKTDGCDGRDPEELAEALWAVERPQGARP